MFIKQFDIVRLRNVDLISIALAKSFNLIPMSKKVRNFFSLCGFFLQCLYGFLRKSSGNTDPNECKRTRNLTCNTSSLQMLHVMIDKHSKQSKCYWFSHKHKMNSRNSQRHLHCSFHYLLLIASCGQCITFSVNPNVIKSDAICHFFLICTVCACFPRCRIFKVTKKRFN